MQTLKFENGGFQIFESAVADEVTYTDWAANGTLTTGVETLVIDNDLDVQTIERDLSIFRTIILEIPQFKDGRAYSQARRLRDQLNFLSEIRVRGDIGRDQLLFMIRSGINGFEAPKEMINDFERALKEFSVFYQGAADRIEPIWRLRTKHALAA